MSRQTIYRQAPGVIRFTLALLLCLLPVAVPADDSSRDFGAHVVHCMVMPSNALDSKTATQLGIVPSNDHGVLNIAIMEKAGDGGKNLPASGKVTAHWSDLNGMMGTIAVREIHDQDAIFYVGEFDLHPATLVTFDILISIDNSRPPYHLTFNKQFADS